jgi:hypothetical protein
MSYFLFYLSPEFMAIAFLGSLTLYFQPNMESYLRFFPLFLFMSLIVETISDYEAYYQRNNVLLNNLFTVFVFCFYFFTFREILLSPKIKKIVLYILLAYPLLSLTNIFLVQKPGVFHSMTYSLGCLLVVAISIYYFWELFQQTHNVNLARQPAFWICTGLLFYYVCSFPLFGLLNFIQSAKYNNIVRNLIIVLNILTGLLYLSFTIAFLCRLKIRKSM